MSAVDPRIGTQIAGYRIEALLGRGGMGVVYLAEDLALGRKVALKLLSEDLAGDERFRERFLRESRMAAALEDPNVITIYQAGNSDGVLFLAMRYVKGTDLRTVIAEKGRLPAEEALRVVGAVGSALDAAHAEGLVHRDVKPGNILIAAGSPREPAGHVFLADFGLTKRATSGSGPTTPGQFVGTASYTAPEQIQGRNVDGRADQYALGCVLFQCLTGQMPFERDDDWSMMWAHVHEPPPSILALRPEVNPAIDAVLGRAMAKAPEARYPSCMAFVAEARRALQGAGVPAGAGAGPATFKGPVPGMVVPGAPARGPARPDIPAGAPATLPGAVPTPGAAYAPPSGPPRPDAASGPPSPPSPPQAARTMADFPVAGAPAGVAAGAPTMAGQPPPGAYAPITPPPVPPAGAGKPSGGGNRRMWYLAGGAVALVAVVLVAVIALGGGKPSPGPSSTGPSVGPTTPTTPPSPSVTPVSGTTVYTDDFTDHTQFSVTSTDNYDLSYDGDAYKMLIVADQYRVSAGSPTELDDLGDVGIDVTLFKLSGPDTGHYGVFCGYQDIDNFYFLGLSGGGEAFIAKYTKGDDKVLARHVDPSLSGHFVRFRAECSTSPDGLTKTLRIFVGDSLLAEATDEGSTPADLYPTGRVTVGVITTNDGNLAALYDDLDVESI